MNRCVFWLIAVVVAAIAAAPVSATTCGSVPNSFSPNSTASSSQVNGNFSTIYNCANTNLAPLSSPNFTGTSAFAGFVGIGTTSPLVSLHVDGNNTNIIGINVENDNATPESGSPSPYLSLAQAGSSGYGVTGWANAAVIESTGTGGLVLDGFGPTGTMQFQIYRATKMAIASNGNVGIGTASPSAVVDVNMGSTPHFYVSPYGCGVTYAGIGFSSSFTSCTNYSLLGDGSNTFVNAPSGTFYIGINNIYKAAVTATGMGIGTTSPAQALQVAGTIRQSGCTTVGTLSVNSSGDIICTSDARLKNLLGAYAGGLEVVGQLKPERFTYKSTPKDPVETFEHVGFVAQNVKTAIPQAVGLQSSGYFSLDTTSILAAAVNAINELRTRSDAQAQNIADLTTRLASQVRQITDLRAQLKVHEAVTDRRAAEMNRIEAELYDLRERLASSVENRQRLSISEQRVRRHSNRQSALLKTAVR